MRPELTKDINPEEFLGYYWLKAELSQFCRSEGIPASGNKEELTQKIELYLRTGNIEQTKKRANGKKRESRKDALSLETIITKNHRCSQDVRVFFQSVIPKFHFSTYIQTYFKENIGKTYQDAVDAWHEEEERKKTPGYQREIGKQFQYNQFMRDFFRDPKNKEKTRTDAIVEWNKTKKKFGKQKYE